MDAMNPIKNWRGGAQKHSQTAEAHPPSLISWPLPSCHSGHAGAPQNPNWNGHQLNDDDDDASRRFVYTQTLHSVNY